LPKHEKHEEKTELRTVRRKKSRHAAHHGGAWKVAYADFVTAMMAFFLVMWIVGMSKEVKVAVSGYFQDPKAFAAEVKKQGGTMNFAAAEKANERAKLSEAKQSIENIVAETPEFKSLKKHVDVQMTNEGLRIDLVEANESLFFDEACAKVKPEARNLLGKVAGELKKLPNRVIVEGHTDRRPLSRGADYTNWELSADRANSARRIMAASGVSDDQIAQVRGYAATQPRDPVHPNDSSNRRVSIVVVFKDAGKSGTMSLTGKKNDKSPEGPPENARAPAEQTPAKH